MEKIVYCPSCYDRIHSTSLEDNQCFQKSKTSVLINQIAMILILSAGFAFAQRFFCTETPVICFIAIEILKFVSYQNFPLLQRKIRREILIHETIERIAKSHKRPAPSILISDLSAAVCEINSIIVTDAMLDEAKITNHEVEVIVAHEMSHWLHHDHEISLLAQFVSAIALCGIGYTKSLPLMVVANIVSGLAIRMHHFWRECEADLKGITLIDKGYSKFLYLKGVLRLDRDFVEKKGLLPMIALKSVGPKSFGSGVLGGYPTMGQQLTFVLEHEKLPSFWLSRVFKMISTPMTGDLNTLRAYKPSFP